MFGGSPSLFGFFLFFFSFLGISPKSSYAFSLTLVFASCRIWFRFCNAHFQDYHNFCLLHSSRTYNRVRFPFFTPQCWYFHTSILIQFFLLHVWVGGQKSSGCFFRGTTRKFKFHNSPVYKLPWSNPSTTFETWARFAIFQAILDLAWVLQMMHIPYSVRVRHHSSWGKAQEAVWLSWEDGHSNN